ncbi:4-hydroxy-tetrahydrodipicolinate synthase [Neobittarella massiliensis]|uniref:4-hydroxy-tetrahydrodipicolinate synthase n=1 Tax=Neobittarella massiliensis (ex Bilen et al. 2018) TaxID=2041842 RepID=A0A8J6LUI5_9FIRM|nr:4-hydroxy-tetrahydrodipicolinate synthase [Neobittarella massiliensis]MBC3515760.1 4-hydroxy-tetrahydrodipicolinate synthase [Neobittarella massiliensis]
MKKTVFTGAGVALVTPFLPDGSINYPKLKELIEWQIASGTDSIITCGTTGESATMTDKEHVDVIKFTVDTVAGRVPVVAGAGSNDTAYAVNLSKEAAALGAAALLQVTPYYNKASQRGLYQHFVAIADATDLPVILYNVPSRTGTNIALDTYLKLSEHPNIVATKEASGDISAIAKIFAVCGDKLDVYSGNDDQIVPIMALGGKGVISVLSNVLPKQTHEICAAFLAGDTQKSAQLQLHYLALANALFMDVNPIPVKDALNLMGKEVGGCRLPLCPMDDAGQQKLAAVLRQYDLM